MASIVPCSRMTSRRMNSYNPPRQHHFDHVPQHEVLLGEDGSSGSSRSSPFRKRKHFGKDKPFEDHAGASSRSFLASRGKKLKNAKETDAHSRSPGSKTSSQSSSLVLVSASGSAASSSPESSETSTSKSTQQQQQQQRHQRLELLRYGQYKSMTRLWRGVQDESASTSSRSIASTSRRSVRAWHKEDVAEEPALPPPRRQSASTWKENKEATKQQAAADDSHSYEHHVVAPLEEETSKISPRSASSSLLGGDTEESSLGSSSEEQPHPTKQQRPRNTILASFSLAKSLVLLRRQRREEPVHLKVAQENEDEEEEEIDFQASISPAPETSTFDAPFAVATPPPVPPKRSTSNAPTAPARTAVIAQQQQQRSIRHLWGQLRKSQSKTKRRASWVACPQPTLPPGASHHRKPSINNKETTTTTATPVTTPGTATTTMLPPDTQEIAGVIRQESSQVLREDSTGQEKVAPQDGENNTVGDTNTVQRTESAREAAALSSDPALGTTDSMAEEKQQRKSRLPRHLSFSRLASRRQKRNAAVVKVGGDKPHRPLWQRVKSAAKLVGGAGGQASSHSSNRGVGNNHISAAPTPAQVVVYPSAPNEYSQEILTKALAPIAPPVEFTVWNPSADTAGARIASSKSPVLVAPQEFTVWNRQNKKKKDKSVGEASSACSTDTKDKATSRSDPTANAQKSMELQDFSTNTEGADPLKGLDFVLEGSSHGTIEEEEEEEEEDLPLVAERSLTDFSPVELQLAAKIGEDLVGRYGPYPTKVSVSQQMQALSEEQRATFSEIRDTWEQEWGLKHRRSKQPWTEEIILRTAAFFQFVHEDTIDALRRMPPKHWHNVIRRVTVNKLSDDLKSLAVVPLPRLTTKEATDVVYLCPARFNTSVSPMRLLTYAMNCLYDRHGDALADCKVGLLMNMEGYSFSPKQQQAFPFTDWISWMEFIQGKNGPLRVAQILLVNVSTEFKLVWKARLRSVCHKDFSWRFIFVEDASKLNEYLTPGFESFLPADLPRGQASVQKLVRDFVTYRQALEDIVLESASDIEPEESDDDEQQAKSSRDSATSSPSGDSSGSVTSRHNSTSRTRSSKGSPQHSSRHRYDSRGKTVSASSRSSRGDKSSRSSVDTKGNGRSSSSSGSRRHHVSRSSRSSRSSSRSSRSSSLSQHSSASQSSVSPGSPPRSSTLNSIASLSVPDVSVPALSTSSSFAEAKGVERDSSSRSLPESRSCRRPSLSDSRQYMSMPAMKSSTYRRASLSRAALSSGYSKLIKPSTSGDGPGSSSAGHSRNVGSTTGVRDRRQGMGRSNSIQVLPSRTSSAKKMNRRKHMKRTISLPSLPETIKEEEEDEDDGSIKGKSIRQGARCGATLAADDDSDDFRIKGEKESNVSVSSSKRPKSPASPSTQFFACQTEPLLKFPDSVVPVPEQRSEGESKRLPSVTDARGVDSRTPSVVPLETCPEIPSSPCPTNSESFPGEETKAGLIRSDSCASF